MSMVNEKKIDAADALAEMLSDRQLAHDIAGRFTCGEAETLAAFISTWSGEAAAAWLDLHALGDEETDMHYAQGQLVRAQIEAGGYAAPEKEGAGDADQPED